MNIFVAASAAARTSRLRGMRRALTLSVAAMAMLGAAACTATTTANPTAPATSASASASDPATDEPPAVLAGTRYYLGLSGKEAVIHAVRGDSDEVTAQVPLDAEECVGNSITVSPDGKRLAWLQDSTDGTSGVLMTAAIDGSHKRQLITGVVCLGSRPLVWQGGNYLMVQQGNRSVLMEMVAGKPVNGDPGQETDRAWSADGKCLAAAAGDGGKPYVGGCEITRNYHYDPLKDEAAKYDGWQARSVSMDGRYVSIGWKGTDPSRRDDSFTVVDAATSKLVNLPVSGEVRSIQFAADGRVLVRQATRIVVLDGSFRQLGEVSEPQAVQGLTLLAYVP